MSFQVSHIFILRLLLLFPFQQLLADIQSTVKKVQTKRKRSTAPKQTHTTTTAAAPAAEPHVPQLIMMEPTAGVVRISSHESVHVPHELPRGLFGADVQSSLTSDPLLFAPPKL